MASVSLQEVLTMLEGSSMDNKEDVQKKWRWNECLMCEKYLKLEIGDMMMLVKHDGVINADLKLQK